MITSNDIRRKWLDFFASKGHKIVSSSSLVPNNDPTLMFTNAGMVQFKNIFTGKEVRDYHRATTAQKCVRAGGKHNDLDNVGYTCRHHTFFEMMGNFSFGDYFKEQAITYAYEMITKELGINKDKLCFTVFSEDDDAWNIWKKVSGVSDDKIIRIPTTANFWSMGDTGPCGPCSEIFYDHGDKIFGGAPGTKDEDGDRFVEIWNLVFMQYEQLEDGSRIPLPKPSIDTGAGLERLAAVLQGTHDNYETDALKSLVLAAADELGIKDIYGPYKSSLRVVADHLRSSCFLIADGVTLSNEGRGYVLRRIMRRAMRHAYMMGAKEPLMYKLVPALQSLMAEAYPELNTAGSLITETLRLEETSFRDTLARGIRLLDEQTEHLSKGDCLSGEVAFRLYDTYGFPLDLTQDALRSKGIKVDIEGFDAAMERQKQAARKAWAGSGDTATEKIWFSLYDKFGATEFLGYTNDMAEGQVQAVIQDGKEVSEATAGSEVMLVVNQTPFYAECGGQCGDAGVIENDKVKIIIHDTVRKVEGLFVHIGKVEIGSIKPNDNVILKVFTDRRANIKANHSATHLLHAALRKFLGQHVVQKGSEVTAEHLRFDFAHSKALTSEEILLVEDEVNRNIMAALPVVTQIMSPDAAVKMGAMALFGEKYGEEVRVLTMGAENKPVSIELCGGTHVDNTGNIGSFRILSETAISAGIRRIEAVAGMAAVRHSRKQDSLLNDLALRAKSAKDALPERIDSLMSDKKSLEREVTELRKKLASGGVASNDAQYEEINGIKFIGRIISDLPVGEMKSAVDVMKQKIGSGVVALVCINDGKVSLVLGVTKDISEKVSASAIIKDIASTVGGKGGGRADMAQAGGFSTDSAEEVIKSVKKALEK